VTATYLNFGNLDLAGLDYQLTYRYRTGLGTFTPSISVTQTYRYRTTLTPGSPVVSAVSAAQDTGDWAPRWKGTAALEWRLGVWTTNLAPHGKLTGANTGCLTGRGNSGGNCHAWISDTKRF